LAGDELAHRLAALISREELAVKHVVVVFLFSAFLFWGPGSSSSARAACIGFDSPDCECFVHEGAWDPFGSLIDVAYQTLDTVESCRPDGGKPFYQMQQGVNDPEAAQAVAPVLAVHRRRAWCSETIAYWHREAARPYPGGYENARYQTWKMGNTEDLRLWYMMEESFGGRGRWVESVELDLDEFLPGYNAPCPGVYQQLLGHSPFTPSVWAGPSDGHSQMVDTMTVYLKPGESAGGAIFNFDMSVIEGNSGNQVTNHNVYRDVPRYTPNGGLGPGDFLPGGPNDLRKIRGWGVDLGPDGGVLCNWERIEWVEFPPDTPPVFPEFFSAVYEDEADLRKVAARLEFAEALEEQGGLLVAVDGDEPIVMERPSAREPWVMAVSGEAPGRDRVALRIELPSPLPYEIDSIELEFAGENVPERVSARARHLPRSRVGRHKGDRFARWKRASVELPDGVNTGYLRFRRGVKVRKFSVKLFAEESAIAGDVILTGLQFHPRVHRREDDSPDNP
jgi:hypothetical protein